MKIVRVAVLIAALGVAALGLAAGAAGLLFGLLSGEDQLTTVTLSLSVLVLTVGGGALIAWQAWQSIQGRSSPPFRPRWGWWLLLAFCLVLILGQAVLIFDLLPLLTFPPLHVAAALLPALTIVGLVGRPLGGIARRREMVWQVGSGALLSSFLAGVLESVILGGLFVTVWVFIGLQPGGEEQLTHLADLLENATQDQLMDLLSRLARSPGVVLVALLVAAGLIPLVEEGVKTVGVALMMSFYRPGPAQAFLWGVGSGAGFALAEALFSSASVLDAWGVVALTRSGATLLHCTAGGLMGLAWYFLLVQGRWQRTLGLYAASVGIHALWNLSTVGISVLSFSTLDKPAMGPEQMLAGVGIVGIVGLLVLLILLIVGVLAGLTWYLSKRGR